MDADPGYDTTNFQALRQELHHLNARVTRGGRVRRAAPLGPTASLASAKHTAGSLKRTAAKAASAKPSRSKSKRTTDGESVNKTPGIQAKETKSTAQRVKSASSVQPAAPQLKTKQTPVKAKTSAAKRTKVKAVDKGKARARRLLTMLRRTEDDESSAVPGTDFTEAGVVRLLAHLRKRLSQSSPFLLRLHKVLSRPVAMGVRTSAGVSVERLQLVSRQLQDIETLGWARFQEIRAARRGKQALSPPPSAAVAPRRSGTPRKRAAQAASLESR